MTDPQTPNSPTQTGGPGDGAPASVAPVTPPSPAAEKPAFTPVYVGGKKFEDAESLAKFSQELVTQNQQYQTRASALQPAAPAIPSDPDKELSDLIFEDPLAAVKAIKMQAKSEVMTEFNTIRSQEQAWSQFYRDNADLVGMEDLVEVSRIKMQDRLKHLPLDQAAKELAVAARARLTQLRGTPSGGTELPAGPAVTSDATGGPGQPGVTSTVPTHFIGQLRQFQGRGKKG